MKKTENCQNREYQALLNNIPGGILQCLNEPEFTMIEVNRCFLELFGFSREELTHRFHDQFIQMIHPDDREGVQKATARGLRQDEKTSVQYRVLCKSGGYKWVLDSAQLICGDNGEERICCVMMDVTASKNDREELRLSLERHQIIMDQATDIIFEWDIRTDTLTYSANWLKRFGYEPIRENITQRVPKESHIHPDDLPAFLRLMDSARSGTAYSTAEFRIQDTQGAYCWCRIRATDQYDETGAPIKAVGVITDIREEKRMLDDLRRRAEQDALTGLYNRAETERQIREHLSHRQDAPCALFMIDTDNFKLVNDSQGHLFGDMVLSRLAMGMKGLTRQNDVVGRIGGDEFAIFLRDIPSRQIVVRKAEQLIAMFRQLFQEEGQAVKITCSVGVAVCPKDGEDFQSLYHSADLALYESKRQGKNQYVMYDEASSVPLEQAGYSSLGAAIDSDRRV